MIESKHLPREMVLNKKQRLSPLQKSTECLRLSRLIEGTRKTMSNIRRDRDRVLREVKVLNQEAKRLGNESLFRTKISLILNAVGAAISGGASIAVKKAIGDAISTIGSLIGFSSLEQQITRKLMEAQGKMDKFQNLNGQLDHLEKGIGRAHKKRAELGC